MRTITQPISRSRSAALLLGSLLLIPALLLGSAEDSRGAPVFTFDPGKGGSGNIQVTQTLGWTFDVVDPITVIGLGWYDEGGDGLAMAHEVGLWDSDGTSLASAVVPSGVSAALDGLFRTVFIDPVPLDLGSYVIGGENFASDPERIACGLSRQCGGSLDPIFDPRISLTGAAFNEESRNLMRPPPRPLLSPNRVSTVTGQGFYGASFSVPEPSGVLLFGAGLLGITVLGTTRSKSR